MLIWAIIKGMIVCIPSRGPTVESLMDDRFGRAAFFIIFNTDDGSFRVVENPHARGSGGVGPMAVQFLAQNDVQVLIAPRLGGNADEALKASGITVIIQNPDLPVETVYSQWKQNSDHAS